MDDAKALPAAVAVCDALGTEATLVPVPSATPSDLRRRRVCTASHLHRPLHRA